MTKHSNIKQIRSSDENVLAKSLVDEIIEQTENEEAKQHIPIKNEAAVLLGRLGGLKGGIARAKKLSDQQKSEIAREAARARWNKNK